METRKIEKSWGAVEFAPTENAVYVRTLGVEREIRPGDLLWMQHKNSYTLYVGDIEHSEMARAIAEALGLPRNTVSIEIALDVETARWIRSIMLEIDRRKFEQQAERARMLERRRKGK